MEGREPNVTEAGESPPPHSQSGDLKSVPPSKSKTVRKRTKTGCLTCRKRRIKCGEEKPRCNNCIKSKRDCEGYGQRVVFRHPVGPIPHLGPIPYPQSQSGGGPLLFVNRSTTQPSAQTDSSGTRPGLIPLAPRPNRYDNPGNVYGDRHYPPGGGSQPGQMYHSQDVPQTGQFYYGHEQQPTSPSHDLQSRTLPQHSESTGSRMNQHPYSGYGQEYSSHTSTGYRYSISSQSYAPASDQPQFHQFQSGTTESVAPEERAYVPQEGDNSPPALGQYRPADSGPSGQIITYVEEDVNEDYYDVETDEEMVEYNDPSYPDTYSMATSMTGTRNIARQQPRLSTAYATDDNILASYKPSPTASPLMDPEVAKIFCHFIAAVGPSLSVWERHPVNPSVMLSSVPVDQSQQSLWTYTLPTMALEHQGLLHGMLAFSSWHIARLKGLPLTASYRHYHYALRRISKAVSLPTRRKEIPTLAATLLLGFYEVMCGEHSKWNSHLAGATQLIHETDFATTTRAIRAMRARAREEQRQQSMSGLWLGLETPSVGSAFENDVFADKESNIDEELISVLMGRSVNFDNFGHVLGEDIQAKQDVKLTAKDIEDYRVQSDLYWWYCKNDLIQSMISGNSLMLPYERWGHCPPRAGVGKLDAVYGSFDHFVLWAARVTQFGAKDRRRKLHQIRANGGQWRPPPGFFPPGMGRGGPPGSRPSGSGLPGPPPTHMHGPPPHGPPQGAPAGRGAVPPLGNRDINPPMYGMLPQPGPIRLPSGFAATSTRPPEGPPSPPSSGGDSLETRTSNAELEWQSLVAAGDEFVNALLVPSTGFAPLPPDGAPPIATPFGPALQYRTHTVAMLWAFYYTTRIILERVHPSMPPEAMIAAGVGAFRTAEYAQTVGRIIAGISYSQHPQHEDPMSSTTVAISPSLSGILTEAMVCLFFAGVQYVSPVQRGWTIAKLKDIARLTGGSTPNAIAYGCETVWIKMYEAGKGPEYHRTAPKSQSVNIGQGEVTTDTADPGVRRRWHFIIGDKGRELDLALGVMAIRGDYRGADDEDDEDDEEDEEEM